MYYEMSLKIDESRCIRCGKCTRDCKGHAIVQDPAGRLPVIAPDGGADRCMHCQHCMMICPAAALTIDGVTPESCAPMGEIPSRETMLNLIRQRRSVRDFKQKNVDSAVMADLIDCMRYVPTGVNFRNLHFALIDDIAQMDIYRRNVYERIAEELAKPDVPEAFANHFTGLMKNYRNGEDPMFRTAPHMAVIAISDKAPCPEADPLIALSYFELYAHTLGLSTVWFGRIMRLYRSVIPDVFAPFNIPEGYTPWYAILFGESGLKYARPCNPPPVHVSRVQY